MDTRSEYFEEKNSMTSTNDLAAFEAGTANKGLQLKTKLRAGKLAANHSQAKATV